MTEQGSDQNPNAIERSPSLDATSSGMNRPWLIRIVIIAACLLGYGAWSMYDAYVAYPARGEQYASWAEWQYLGKVIEADSRESPGILRRDASIPEPAAELERLESDDVAERNLENSQGGARERRAQMELARQEWLRSLLMIGRLHPAYTNFYRNPDEQAASELASLEPTTANTEAISGLRSRLDPVAPRDRFNDLNTTWTSESPPAPLRSYDIPVNKIQALICLVFVGYLGFLLAKVASKTYRWDPAGRVLTLPGGVSIGPDDLEDVDKRKWDKFIVFLKVKDSHSQIGGQEVRFDTYRHSHVEEWILEMERTAFPDRVKDEADENTAQAESVQSGDASDAAAPSEDEQARAG